MRNNLEGTAQNIFPVSLAKRFIKFCTDLYLLNLGCKKILVIHEK